MVYLTTNISLITILDITNCFFLKPISIYNASKIAKRFDKVKKHRDCKGALLECGNLIRSAFVIEKQSHKILKRKRVISIEKYEKNIVYRVVVFIDSNNNSLEFYYGQCSFS